MGHGCHDCGSPNSCECPPWEEMQARKKKLDEDLTRSLDDKAQRLLESANSWLEKIQALPHNKGVPTQTLLDRALVIALMRFVR